MSEKAKLLKVSAIIASFLAILCLLFQIIIGVVDGFRIYNYVLMLIVFFSCLKLWKMFINER